MPDMRTARVSFSGPNASRNDIEEHMSINDLKVWGFVFVRATYKNDKLF
jgi:hypothetical protein